MGRRSLNRRSKSRPRHGRRRRLMQTAFGPWLRVIFIVALVFGGFFAVYKYALPPVLKMLNIQWPPATPAPPSPTPAPTHTPHPLTSMEATEIQREIEIDSEMRFATDPMRFEGQVIFTGGVDENNAQKNVKVVIYDIEAKTQRDQNGLPMENDDYFQPQMNRKWIVYLDHKRSGGGMIRAYDREEGKSFIVKEYYIGMPTITLNGDRLCWVERTGSYRDKVFLFDLVTQENVCLETLEHTVFGQSACHMSDKEIVWAGLDPQGEGRDLNEINGAIWYFSLDGTSSSKERYDTETYVHNPKTNGTARAWIDKNGGPNATLYLSVNGGAKIAVDTDVTGFGLGSNFVAYCKTEPNTTERMRVYFWESPGSEPVPNPKDISIAGERCIFSGVSEDTVFWFVTGVSQNDILKYAAVNELSANEPNTAVSSSQTAEPTATPSPSPTPN